MRAGQRDRGHKNIGPTPDSRSLAPCDRRMTGWKACPTSEACSVSFELDAANATKQPVFGFWDRRRPGSEACFVGQAFQPVIFLPACWEMRANSDLRPQKHRAKAHQPVIGLDQSSMTG